MDSFQTIYRLRTRFKRLFMKKTYFEAILLGEKILDTYKKSGLEDSPGYADDLFNIAAAYEKLNSYSKALVLYTESQNAILKKHGKNLAYSYRLNNSAVIQCKLGNYDGAIKIFKEILELQKMILKEGDYEETVTTLYNLGNTHAENAEYEEALDYLTLALSKRKKIDLAYADNLNSIGYVYESLEDNRFALQFCEQALETIKKLTGSNSDETLKNTYYLAKLYEKDNDFETAAIYFETALKGIERILGRVYPYYTDCLTELATIYSVLKEYKKAEKYLLESYKIKEKLSDTGYEYIRDLTMLLCVYIEMGEADKALNIMVYILDNIERDDDHFNELIVELAKVYLSFGDINKLNEIYNKAVNMSLDGKIKDIVNDLMDDTES